MTQGGPTSTLTLETRGCCLSSSHFSLCQNGRRSTIQSDLLQNAWNLQSSTEYEDHRYDTGSSSGEDDENNVSTLMAREFTELSSKERQEITEEIHGVSGPSINEEPDFVEQQLNRLEVELGKIGGKARVAYDLAMASNPNLKVTLPFKVDDELI